MNKKTKRIYLLITVLFVIMFLMSSYLIFGQVKNNLLNEYRAFQGSLSSRSTEDYYKTLTANELAAEYTDCYSGFNSYAWGVALYNKDNEMVEISGSHIKICDEIKDTEENIFIDKCLSSENKLEIQNFQNKMKHPSAIDIIELNYIEKDNTKIPVSFVLVDVNKISETIKIVLSEETNFKTIKKGTPYTGRMWINLVDINEKSYLHKSYNYVYNQLRTADIDNLFENHSGGEYSGPEEQLGKYYMELADGEYVLVISSVFHPNIETFKSAYFLETTIMQGICFTIFYCIAIIALKKYFNRSKKLEDTKTAFASAAAHELKTPLAVIENQCECIIENIAPEKNDEYINSIYTESLRMNKLVASLLQYNRLASTENIAKENCRLDELLNSEIEKYKSSFNIKNIYVETYIYNNAEIKCNPELISLVMDNYLSNAVKHTNEGKKIIISLKKNEKSYVFMVYNEGKTIATTNKEELFDIFWKTDKSRKRDDNSTGMGLAICKEILEQHHYSYGFINKNNGVEFYFAT